MAGAAQPVWLGLPGDMVGPEEELDHHATKCGGAPRFPGATPPLRAADARCRVCSRPLSLVLQVRGGAPGRARVWRAAGAVPTALDGCAWAPRPAARPLPPRRPPQPAPPLPALLPSAQAYAPAGDLQDRCLLVFGCTAEGCGRQPGSWRAWRCHAPPAAGAAAVPGGRAEQEQRPAAQQQQQPEPAAAAKKQGGVPGFDFGAAGDDWGLGGGGAFDMGGQTGGGGAFDFSELTSAVEAAAADLSTAKQRAAAAGRAAAAAAAAEASAAGAAAGGGAGSCVGGGFGLGLPEFHVYAEEEPGDAPVPERELQHARQLLARYQAAAEDAGAGAPSAAPPPGARAGGGSGGKGGGGKAGGDEGGPEAWAGEGYEPTRLRGVVRSYVKFSKRLARAPRQCARCAGGRGRAGAGGGGRGRGAPQQCARCAGGRGRAGAGGRGRGRGPPPLAAGRLRPGGRGPARARPDPPLQVANARPRPRPCPRPLLPRYCPGGAPLWPAPAAPTPPPCPACGAPRAFELQLMPALISMIVEAGDMEAGGGGSSAGGVGSSSGEAADNPGGGEAAS
jgi:hypothetical protein